MQLLDKGLLKELLVRLYQEEQVLVSVPDGVYNDDYARDVAENIFSYLVPSLRKMCLYASAEQDLADVKGAALKIVPRSAVADGDIKAFDASVQGHVCVLESELCEWAERLISSTFEIRERVFSYYETLSGGYAYSPKRFLDFYKSLSGDVYSAEKLVDAYLANIGDPSVDTVPDYAVKLMRSKYNSGTQAAAFLEVSNVAELADPLSVLESKASEVKKIYLFNDNPEAVFASAFERVLNSIELTDEAFKKLSVGAVAFLKREKNETVKFKIAFENAVETLYKTSASSPNGKLRVCGDVRKQAAEAVGNYFAYKVPKKVLDDSELETVRKNIRSECSQLCETAKGYKYDLGPFIDRKADTAAADHNEKHKVVSGISKIGTEEIQKLDTLSFVLTQKLSLAKKQPYQMQGGDPEVLMLEIMSVYRECPNIINLYAARHAIRKKNTLIGRKDSVLTELAQEKGRIRIISEQIFEDDPLTAIKLCAGYAPIDEAVVATVELVRDNAALFNSVDPRNAESAVNTVAKILNERLQRGSLSAASEALVNDALEEFPEKRERETSFKMAGNIKLFYDAVSAAWEAACSNMPYKPKKKRDNKAALWIVIALLVLSLAGGGIALLFALDVFGGSGNNVSDNSSEPVSSGGIVSDNSDYSDGSEASAESSDQSQDSGASDTSSDNTSDESSQPSDEPGVPVAPATEITVNGDGTAASSNVSFLANSRDGVTWNRVIILTENQEDETIFTVSEIRNSDSGVNTTTIVLNNTQYALGFYLAEDDEKAEVEAMMAYADSFAVGDTLVSADRITFALKAEEVLGEGTLLIDRFNEPLASDNMAIMYAGVTDSTRDADMNDFLAVNEPDGFHVLLAPTETANVYTVVEVQSEKQKFTSEADPNTMIVILFHWRNDGGSAWESARERYNNAKELLVSGARVEITGFDFSALQRSPSGSDIYITVEQH